MMARHRRCLPAMLCAALSACAVTAVPTPPAPAMPAHWHEAPDSHASATQADAAWWTTFHDQELDHLIERARQSNVDLQLAQARLREARARRTIAGAARLPSIGAAASMRREQDSENAPNPLLVKRDGEIESPGQPENLFQAGFDAKWELDLFGATRRATEAAQADLDAAAYDRGALLLSLLAEVSRNYIELRGIEAQRGIARASLASQQETLALIRARRAGGLAADLDAARAEAQVERTAARLPTLDMAYKKALYRLDVLVGEPPGTLADELRTERPLAAPPALPALGLPSDLLRQRPDIRSAERAVAAAGARLGMAKADLYPRFTLLGTVGLASVAAGNLFSGASVLWSVGPSITWPILRGGQVVATIEVRDAQQQQALIVYRRAILQGMEDAENAMAGYRHEQARRAALARTVDMEGQAAAFAQGRYLGGLADFREVLDAQRALFQAQSDLALSDTAVSLSLVALYKALGGGWNMDPQGAGAARPLDQGGEPR
ncbi:MULTISPECIES: efflux transporter outer membrane subunit [Cupriavidus]|uniref:RND transporter n=1 Tax=Cupriavidus malaysiensis TaxID=367825 RepID=A0ABN4TQ90_9BURK|nr:MULTISPECIES: efflux transporter outer membrane subunit [Cupriavidus]AOZ08589.1 hypothetical protein BKK80_21850 [Cupriavidus malaysiensis]